MLTRQVLKTRVLIVAPGNKIQVRGSCFTTTGFLKVEGGSTVQRTKCVVLDSSSTMAPPGENSDATPANGALARKLLTHTPSASPSISRSAVTEAEPSSKSREVMISPPRATFCQPLGHGALHLARTKAWPRGQNPAGVRAWHTDYLPRRAMTSLLRDTQADVSETLFVTGGGEGLHEPGLVMRKLSAACVEMLA